MIPTAEEAVLAWQKEALAALSDPTPTYKDRESLLEMHFIKFARLHVEAALSAASKVKPQEDWYRGRFRGCYLKSEDIFLSYPLENIQ